MERLRQHWPRFARPRKCKIKLIRRESVLRVLLHKLSVSGLNRRVAPVAERGGESALHIAGAHTGEGLK